jgi:rhamnogalacturonyl hydrolase YesR
MYSRLPLLEIKPTGWIKHQLETQLSGLSSHLPYLWPDIAQSGWIGGLMEGWERGPYWLDGAVGLAHLTGDERLLGVVKAWFDFIFASQGDDGNFGPNPARGNMGNGVLDPTDPWPHSVVLKAMVQYADVVGDAKVVLFMDKYFRYLEKLLEKKSLYDWGKFRWQTMMLGVHWLYEKTEQDYLLKLASTLYTQGADWDGLSQNFLCKGNFIRSKCNDTMTYHGVNLAQAIKAMAVWYRQNPDPKFKKHTDDLISVLDIYHGTSVGVFKADELVSGRSPQQGTETCQVVEYLFSLEILISIFGDAEYGDRMELIAFNSLPASFTEDMWYHVYFHQANQIMSTESNPWVDGGPQSNMYGMSPNYGCCTANFNQGWPKYVQHMWMKNETLKQLVLVSYGPCFLNTRMNGVDIFLESVTNYPFEDNVAIQFNTSRNVEISFCFRIPKWIKDIKIFIDGENIKGPCVKGRFYCSNVVQYISLVTHNISIQFTQQPSLWNGMNNAIAIQRGPLTFSYQIPELRYGVNDNMLMWRFYNNSEWNYGLRIDPNSLDNSISFKFNNFNERCAFCAPSSITAQVKAERVPTWTFNDTLVTANPPPVSPVNGDGNQKTLNLVPYGIAKLRVTEFPLLR